MLNVFYLLAGFGMLTLGGEALIRGTLGIAKLVGISPLLSGLLIVGFGTSAPEMAVSVKASLNGNPDIAVGNVVGSNIANVLLVLGLCATILPLSVSRLALRRDALSVIVASVIFIPLVQSGLLSRPGALLLLLLLILYFAWTYISEKKSISSIDSVYATEAEEVNVIPRAKTWSALAVLTGFLFLIFGSQVFLIGAVGIAESMGLSEILIGLTLVAIGTSLPELTMSVIAALRGHADVAIGNVLGSNIFNLLGILGVSALLQPLRVSERVLQFDQWVMLGVALLLFVFLYTGKRLSRMEGAFLLTGYITYIVISFFLPTS